jgi:hypothetical protein
MREDDGDLVVLPAPPQQPRLPVAPRQEDEQGCVGLLAQLRLAHGVGSGALHRCGWCELSSGGSCRGGGREAADAQEL